MKRYIIIYTYKYPYSSILSGRISHKKIDKNEAKKKKFQRKQQQRKKTQQKETRNFDGLMKYESDPINKCVRKGPNSKLIEFL